MEKQPIIDTTKSIDPLISYLRKLRTKRKLSREMIAEAIDVPARTLADWETGAEPRARAFLRWILYMNVPEAHLRALTRVGATEKDAEDLAEAHLRARDKPRLDESETIQLRIHTIAQRLGSDPLKLGAWLGYGDGLVDSDTGDGLQ